MESPPMAKLILVLGPTGSGKSSLIASATGHKALVGHTMESCTQTMRAFPVGKRSAGIYLVDTRGFNDSNVSDIRNVLELAQSLCSRELFIIHGVIYLHSIKETKFAGTAQLNLDLLRAICGDAFWPHVVLATTMWDELPPDVTLHQKFERRHTELEGMYWKDMIEKGALVSKYTGSKTSVLDMVDMLINTKMTPPLLKMQKEALDLRVLSETSIGKAVALTNSIVRRRLENRLKEGDTEGDFEGKDGAAERLDLQESLESIESELALLRVALPFEKSELHDVARQDVNIWDVINNYRNSF